MNTKTFLFLLIKNKLKFHKRESILDEVLNSEPYKSFNLLNEKNYQSFYSLLGKSSASMFFSDKGFGLKIKVLRPSIRKINSFYQKIYLRDFQFI